MECPRAEFRSDGAILNLESATGELVNLNLRGFEGYYKNEEATTQRFRDGKYWSVIWPIEMPKDGFILPVDRMSGCGSMAKISRQESSKLFFRVSRGPGSGGLCGARRHSQAIES